MSESDRTVWPSIEDVIAAPDSLRVGDWIRGIGDVLCEQQRHDIVAVCNAVRKKMSRDSYLGRVQSENTRLRKRIRLLSEDRSGTLHDVTLGEVDEE